MDWFPPIRRVRSRFDLNENRQAYRNARNETLAPGFRGPKRLEDRPRLFRTAWVGIFQVRSCECLRGARLVVIRIPASFDQGQLPVSEASARARLEPDKRNSHGHSKQGTLKRGENVVSVSLISVGRKSSRGSLISICWQPRRISSELILSVSTRVMTHCARRCRRQSLLP